MKRLRFGFLATGTISRRLAKTMQLSTTCELVAAASRLEEKAREFAAEFQVDAVTGYEALLERDDIDAVYVATPHPQHHKWCLRAIEHGRHVLCEKPLTMTLSETREIAAAATSRGVLVMEAFMYRHHPQTKKLLELVSNGTIGEVRWIQADFGYDAAYDASSRLFAKGLGGGAILDVGCYTVSMARMLAGAAGGRDFLDPVSIAAVGQSNERENTDNVAGALMKFPGNVLATVRCATRLNLGQSVRIEGTQGVIEVNQPWFAGSKGATILIRTSGEETILETETATDLYSFMLDEFAACWREGRTTSRGMSLADSTGNMQVLEEWYRAVGVSY